MFKLGLIVNPFAGLGGPAALKGSDAPDTRERAVELGLESKVGQRVQQAIEALLPLRDALHVYCAGGDMGESVLRSIEKEFPQQSLRWHSVYSPVEKISTAEDSYHAALAMEKSGVDLVAFCGGDGTARDVCRALSDRVPVIGIPAGVKMHSGVFGVTPNAVASLLKSMIQHKLVAVVPAEVRDIDERSFQQGVVRTRHYGEMLVPDDQLLVQAVKNSGVADDELAVQDMVAYILETMEENCLYVLGSGGSLKQLKDQLGFDGSLLGVDLYYNGECIACDVNEPQLFELLQSYSKVRLLVSVIGGQGIVFGRGNQQLSSRILRQIGKANIQILATLQKLRGLGSRPLWLDTGEDELDRQLAGYYSILTGYEQTIYYELAYIKGA